MPQKTLTSFFSNKPLKPGPEEPVLSPKKRAKNSSPTVAIEPSDSSSSADSPVKVKRRRIFVESDDSCSANETSSKISKTEVSKSTLEEFSPLKSVENIKKGQVKTPAKSPATSKATTSSSSSKKSTPAKLSICKPKVTPGDKKSAQQSPLLLSTASSSKSTCEAQRSPETASSPVCRSEAKKEKESTGSPLKYSPTGAVKQPTSYDPTLSNYHPLKNAAWSKGESVPYLCLTKTFEFIDTISGRLKIIEALSNFYRSVGLLSPDDFAVCIYLCLNRLGPSYEGLELGIGDSLLMKALGTTTGVGMDHIKSECQRLGDLGAVAEVIRSKQRTMFTPKPLTVAVVFQKLKEIALMTGNTAQTKKVDKIRSLLVACRESEAKFLIRSLSGKLRIGLAEQSVLTALGQAVAQTPFHSISAVQDDVSRLLDLSAGVSTDKWKARLEQVVGAVKKAYCVCPNYDILVHGLLTDGPDGLDTYCSITPGIPLKPMLAHPTRGVADVLKRFDETDFTCEYKYDGERAQIHVNESEVHVYSRNQEDNTNKYPDIVKTLMPRVLESSSLSEECIKLLNSGGSSKDVGTRVISCIIDSEVVAWDRQADHILPFQVLSTRKRKDVEESSVKVQICVYCFDLLYLNGVSLIERSLRERRQILKLVFPQFHGEFMMANSLDSSDTDEIATFLEESVKGNCEGLMVKTLDKGSTYEIAKRSHNWLKLKKDYLEGVGDTLDLVVIGGFHGSGKRAGRYGGFLLACYDAASEEYQTVCKIGTGMKDEDLVNFSNFFKDHVAGHAKSYYQYTSGLVPDHWFEPVQVWEVKAADLSISPAHKAAAGLADPEKGISLRFPRFLRVREDKKPEEATTARQIYDMYMSQEQIKNQETTGEQEEDFY